MRAHLGVSLICGLCLVLLTALTGSSGDAVDLANIQDQAVVPAGALGAGEIGQTFIAHTARLHAIQVRWIVSGDFRPAPGSRVTLHLRDGVPGETRGASDLATTSAPLAELRNNGFTTFTFSPVQDSDGRSFYFYLDLDPAAIRHGDIALWASDEDAYPSGKMYVDGLATDRDLVFRVYYEPDGLMLAAALGSALGRYGTGTLVALFLFLISGLLLVPLDRLEMGKTLGVGLGVLSAASILLLVLRIDNPIVPRVGIALLVLAALARVLLAFRTGSFRLHLVSLGWGLLAVVSFFTGLLQIRDLLVPLWVDSFTHAQLVQMILAQGQLPAISFYHLGFHAVTAFLIEMSGLDIPQAMLLMGPLLITQAGLSLGLLSRRLTGSVVAALVSGVCVWFLSPTPSYLTTWGRYPLMMGAALLPVALVTALDWIDSPRWSHRVFALAMVLFAGLAFAQVRLTVFYIVFMALYLLQGMLRSPALARRQMLKRSLAMLAVGIGLGMAWLTFVFLRGLEWQTLLAENTAAPSIDLATAVAVSLTHHGPELIGLAIVGAGIGIVRRTRAAALALTWYAVLYAASLIPRSPVLGSLISPDLVVLMGFLPTSLLVGDGIAFLFDRFQGGDARKHLLIWAATGALVILLGIRDLSSIVNPATVQFSSADAQGMEWIQEHTPPQARFLVNSFNWFDSVYSPSDGGTWIPILTGRSIDFAGPESSSWTQDPEALAAWVDARQIDFVYLGWKGGELRRAEFMCRPDHFTLAYSRNGVEIYRVNPRGHPGAGNALPPDCSARG